MNNTFDDFIIYGTVKVGERGQIVIPSKARRDFGLTPGDLLLVIARSPGGRLGLGLVKADLMKEFMERIIKEMEIQGNRRARSE